MLSEIIKEKRKEKNLTQQQLADILHISRQSISNWENNKSFPDVPMLVDLSKYFDFSLDILKGDSNLLDKIRKDYNLIYQ